MRSMLVDFWMRSSAQSAFDVVKIFKADVFVMDNCSFESLDLLQVRFEMQILVPSSNS